MTSKTISVVGLGKLGKPIYDVLSKYYKVIGIDKNQEDCSFKNLGDITFVVVPTPSVNNKFISDYVEDVLKEIKHKHLVVIVSTLYPGETDRLQKKYPHLTLVYNPTFVALGQVAHDFTHPDLVLIGHKDPDARRIVSTIHSKIVKTSPDYAYLTPLEAEIAKLTLNCYITTKITFANQIGNLCYRLKIKPDNILDAVGADRRIGNRYFKAGLGYGGPCFPRDNLAMSTYMLEHGLDPALTRTIHKLNELQVNEILNRIMSGDNMHIGFSGLSYKEGTDCEENSQIKEIFFTLKSKGFDCKIGKSEVNITWDGIESV